MPKWGLTDEQRHDEPWGLSADLLAPSKTITDPVHGDIYLNELEKLILDSAPMQRLRRVRQLGTTYLVYPGAAHSRLSHSLGALRAAQDLLDAVIDNRMSPHRTRPDLFDQWADIEEADPDERSATVQFRLAEATVLARLGALMHDMCHVPFGHTIEDDLKVLTEHDKNAKRLKGLWRQLPKPVLKAFKDADPALTTELHALIMSKQANTNWRSRYPFVEDIVGNTICADLLDYIRRDHLFTGLPLAVGDRFVDDFYVVGADHVHYPEKMAVTVTRGGKQRADVVTELLKFLRYRYELSERALYHHGKVAADAMIGKLLEMWSDAEWADAAAEEAAAIVDAVGAQDITKLQQAVRADDPRLATRIDAQVRDTLEAEFVKWSDDGLLEYLALVARDRADSGDRRFQAIAELLASVLNRQLYKPLGHARGGDAVALAEEVYKRFGLPEHRRSLERAAAEFAELPQGWHVVLWVPNPRMKLKVADVLVDADGEIMPLSRYTKSGDDIAVAHRALWGVEVYGHRNVRDDLEKTDAILSYIAQELGITFKRRDGSEVPKPRELAVVVIGERLRLTAAERTSLLDLVPAAKAGAGTFRAQLRQTQRVALRNGLGSPS